MAVSWTYVQLYYSLESSTTAYSVLLLATVSCGLIPAFHTLEYEREFYAASCAVRMSRTERKHHQDATSRGV